MATVLVTRPRDAAERTAAHLRRLGHTPLLAPVSEIERLDVAMPDLTDVQAVLVTSRNAVAAVAAWRPARPVWAVGRGSAEALDEAGVPVAGAGEGDGGALAGLLATRLDPATGALLHACGATTATDLRDALVLSGFAYRAVMVYRARRTRALPEEARLALAMGRVSAVTLHSPKSAERFLALLEAAGLGGATSSLTALCLSPNVAAAAASAAWRSLLVAARPDEAGMGRLLEAAAL